MQTPYCGQTSVTEQVVGGIANQGTASLMERLHINTKIRC